MGTVLRAGQDYQPVPLPVKELGRIEVSVVMPCLNEAETVGSCIGKAQRALSEANITGEVIVADNGSTDGSVEIAERMGARVVNVRTQGIWECLDGRNCCRARPIRGDGRRGRQLRFRAHPAICRAVARGRRSGDGEPLSRGNRAGRHAVFASVFGESLFVGDRKASVPQSDWRFSLRASGVQQRCVFPHGIANHGDGVCQ